MLFLPNMSTSVNLNLRTSTRLLASFISWLLTMEHTVVVIGSAGAGKSCCTIRFVADRFVKEYEPTLEDSFRQEVCIDGITSMLNIYDTAGVEDFPIVKDGYMRDADGFLCVYAINSPESFEEVPKLYDWVLRVKDNKKPPFMLLGNKIDLESSRVITTQQGEELAKSLGIMFLETSALTGHNIEKAFTQLVREVRKAQPKPPPKNPGSNQKQDNGQQRQGGKCCVLL